jgi:hypothetical protein
VHLDPKDTEPLDANPQSGEQSVYKPEFDPVTNQLTRDYSLVLMLPNETKKNAFS